MESIQYNPALAITDGIRVTSTEKRYQELGLESPHKRRWYRKLCYFFKIFKGESLEYILKIPLALAKHIIQEQIMTFPTSVLNIIFLEIL